MNSLYSFLDSNGFDGEVSDEIEIPKVFSILHNTDESLQMVASIHTSVHVLKGSTIRLNFAKCEKTDLHTLMILRIIFNEYRFSQHKLQGKLQTFDVLSNLLVHPSRHDSVNKKLVAVGILSSITTPIDDMMPISTTGIFKGDKNRRHFQENQKGAVATKITAYVSQVCADRYKCRLGIEAKSELQSLVAEVLNNAEDHGLENVWFAAATLFEANRLGKVTDDEVIGELSITIMNFGHSFYEGFEGTKVENIDEYDEVDRMYKMVSAKRGGSKFSRENYFTLYALQDGVSRLKFKQESRGTGTMKFINSFLFLGDYEDSSGKYQPSLAILTGHTLLTCNTKYRTFKLGNNDY